MQSGQNQMSSPMGPQGGTQAAQVMSPSGQPMQQMPMGQFQIIQPQMGNPGTQFAQIATYNQQGQLVLQPANFAFPQQAGGQQYILAAAPPQIQQQKPGQQIMTSAQQQTAGTKTMVPMSMSPASSYSIASSGMTANAPQTFMIAPMGGAPIMASQAMAQAPMTGQIKSDSGKQNQQQQAMQQVNSQQSILMPQGMAYMAPPGQTAQAIFQNGQIIFRSPMPDGSQPQLMFSPPTHSMPQQPTLQGTPTQLPPGITSNMQPISMQSTGTMRPPATVPSQIPPGKTPISRNIAPLLPTVSTTTAGMKSSYSSMSSNLPGSSPKGKQKMSPRGSGGHVGRPPGPSKSAVNSLKMPIAPSMSPPVLATPQFPAQSGSPMTLGGGPPILQTSVPVAPASRGSPLSQPPTLQPMMLPPVSTSSSQDLSKFNGKTNDSQPPTLSAQAPIPTSTENSRKSSTPVSSSGSNKKSDSSEPMVTGPETQTTNQTPKAVVKPNVLTHVIDGHVIQESSQPFPLDNSDSKGRNSHNKENGGSDGNNKIESKKDFDSNKNSDSSVSKTMSSTSATTTSTTVTNIVTSAPLTTTKTMGPKLTQVTVPQMPVLPENKSKLSSKTVDIVPEKKRGPGRPPGSTKQNLEQQKMMTQSNGGELKGKIIEGPPSKKSKVDLSETLKVSTGSVSPTKPSSKSPILNIDVMTNNPLKWTVTQVCDFVKSLPGCSDYVEDFQLQEIDGQALMLLKADHLMSAMAIKLGPALKICSAIDAMREELKQN